MQARHCVSRFPSDLSYAFHLRRYNPAPDYEFTLGLAGQRASSLLEIPIASLRLPHLIYVDYGVRRRILGFESKTLDATKGGTVTECLFTVKSDGDRPSHLPPLPHLMPSNPIARSQHTVTYRHVTKPGTTLLALQALRSD